MQHQEFGPPEELQDTIKCFWYNSKDFGEQRSEFEVIPDGYAEIVFHFGSGCSISHNGSLQSLPSPFMMGLLDFDNNALLKTWAGAYGDRIRYISGNVKDRLGISAVVIRPDGIIAWVAGNDPDLNELPKAAARWFVSN